MLRVPTVGDVAVNKGKGNSRYQIWSLVLSALLEGGPDLRILNARSKKLLAAGTPLRRQLRVSFLVPNDVSFTAQSIIQTLPLRPRSSSVLRSMGG